MQIVEIHINNYKSINSWQRIVLNNNLITLIGKNGSGKTTVLEALSGIFDSNALTNYYPINRVTFDYKILIKLNKEELRQIDSTLEYDKENCMLEAYCAKGEYDLRVNRIKSKSLVDVIRRKENDLALLAKKLYEKLESYTKIVDNFDGVDNHYQQGCFCVEVDDFKKATNYGWQINAIKNNINWKKDEIKRLLGELIDSDNDSIIIRNAYFPNQKFDESDISFELKYIAPRLTKFESQYITINVDKIKTELDKINNQTAKERKEIVELITKINSLCQKISRLAEQENNTVDNREEKYFARIKKIQKKIKRRCFFLRNENNTLIFGEDQSQRQHYSNINERLIMEAYIKTYVKPDKRDEMLKTLLEGNLQVMQQEAFSEQLEKIINEDIPNFDKGMYQKVKVKFVENRMKLMLVESDGKEVDFHHTSTGRRWYFTYYFIKKCLIKNDILIIDEPASFLHPDGQVEVLNDLQQLAKKDIQIIYSTHSPYLIPQELSGINIISINNGTNIKEINIQEDLFDNIKEGLGGCGANDFLLKLTKPLIFVEGVADEVCLKKFMQLFSISQEKYNLYVCNGNAILDTVMFCIKNKTPFKALLDYDTLSKPQGYLNSKPYYKGYIEVIKQNENCIFTPENGVNKCIEDLFAGADREKYLKSVKGKPKLNIKAIEQINMEDLTPETIFNFRQLFTRLNIF